MFLQNECYKIDIQVDSAYTIGSSDNKRYEVILNPNNFISGDFYKTYSISVESRTGLLRLALVGDYYICEEDCAVLEGNILTILLNNMVAQIDVETAAIITSVIIDDLGVNFGIYSTDYGYIVHGEINIQMLDRDLHTKWIFSGKDIFVSVTDKTPFELCDDRIKLYDFEDNYYEIDYNGNLITTS